MKNLHSVLVQSRPAVEGTIFAAGPLMKQPCTLPFRFVMIEREKDFIVTYETFEKELVEGELATEVQSHISNSYYYQKDDLVRAIKKFASLLERSAESAQSLYRDVA